MNKRFEQAFNYLQNTDFSTVEIGNYEIESKAAFAMVQEYDSRYIGDCSLEAHRKYIDIQLIIAGKEDIGISILDQQKSNDGYSQKKDLIFFEDDPSFQITLGTGEFAIFFPRDLHMPGIKVVEAEKVKKVVVKVAI